MGEGRGETRGYTSKGREQRVDLGRQILGNRGYTSSPGSTVNHEFPQSNDISNACVYLCVLF